MFRARYQTIRNFYDEIIDYLSSAYPTMRSDSVGLVKILPAFSDKLPLVEVLHDHNLLSTMVLKKGSSYLHSDIAQKLKDSVSCPIVKSDDITPDQIIPILSDITQGRRFIIGDHGGYFAESLPYLTRHFEKQLLGVTEHTRNGEVRIQSQLKIHDISFPFLSSAQSPLKSQSDQTIAGSIINEIMKDRDEKTTILIVGYGSMGAHAANKLRTNHPDHDVIIVEERPDQRLSAKSNGYDVFDVVDEVISHADIVLLATNRVKGQDPVLCLDDVLKMKQGGVLTSMTSIEDEIDLEKMIFSKRLNQNNIKILNGGSPVNTLLETGGADLSICKVEALGIAHAFYLADMEGSKSVPEIPPRDLQRIEKIYKNHFH